MRLFKRNKGKINAIEVKQPADLNAPLISVSISALEKGVVGTSSAAIKRVADIIGDERTASWHSFYMKKYQELTDDCWNDFHKAVNEAITELQNKKE